MQKKRWIGRIFSLVVSVVIIIIGYTIYQNYNFNEYIKAESTRGLSNFTRDAEVTYVDNVKSYKIENTDYNNAVFYKTIQVEPNTPYKVTCMIKTQNVETQNAYTDAGAHIGILGTTEKSSNVIGTTEWKKVEFLFNSKNRTEVTIQFGLGGYADECKGTAWFSDFSLEMGVADTSREWNFLCLLLQETDVNINGTELNFQLTTTDIEDMNLCMQRFASSLAEMSNYKMTVNYDMIQINTPITHLAHDEVNGYYLAPMDIENVLQEYVEQGKYDHIFVCFRTGDLNQQIEDENGDWIGLRGNGLSKYRVF